MLRKNSRKIRTRRSPGRRTRKETLPSKPRIGLKLRHARLTKGMNLKQVATAIGCSESFLSKLENDRVGPSLAVLHRLVDILEINVTALFNDTEADNEPVLVLHPKDRQVIRVDPLWRGAGIELERLIPNARAALLQANVHVVSPGASSDGMIHHAGEELGYVLEGRLDLNVDNVIYRLEAGNSFFFPSSLPHGYRNPGKTTTRVLWVNSPPTF